MMRSWSTILSIDIKDPLAKLYCRSYSSNKKFKHWSIYISKFNSVFYEIWWVMYACNEYVTPKYKK